MHHDIALIQKYNKNNISLFRLHINTKTGNQIVLQDDTMTVRIIQVFMHAMLSSFLAQTVEKSTILKNNYFELHLIILKSYPKSKRVLCLGNGL